MVFICGYMFNSAENPEESLGELLELKEFSKSYG